MNRRTFVLGMGAAAAGGSVLLGSGSFSTSESQRTTRVETVGDEQAYLVLQYPDVSFGCEETVTLLTLTNQFTEPITDVQADVSVVDSNSDISLDNIGTPDTLDIGETGEVTADAVCETSGSATETVSIDIDAKGEESFVAAADRSLEVSCDCGDQPTGGPVPEARVDEPPHSPVPPSDPGGDKGWDKHWLGEGMATEPSYPFEPVTVSLADPELDGAPPPWRSTYAVTLVTSVDELESIIDMETPPDRLENIDFSGELVVVVESGHGSSALEHVWQRVVNGDGEVYLHGYDTRPRIGSQDYSPRHSAIVVEKSAEETDVAHVSHTVGENRRVNVDSSEGVVTVEEDN